MHGQVPEAVLAFTQRLLHPFARSYVDQRSDDVDRRITRVGKGRVRLDPASFSTGTEKLIVAANLGNLAVREPLEVARQLVAAFRRLVLDRGLTERFLY